MAVYFDKSYFPYNPSSDISAYGDSFHRAQPDLPADIIDQYRVRSWQRADNYGDFQHTRGFVGMLNQFIDRPSEDMAYFKSLSDQDQLYARATLSQRSVRYVTSGRQTSANPLGQFDASLAPSVYADPDYNNDPDYDPEYAPGQLLWSLVGRSGQSGEFLNQIQSLSVQSVTESIQNQSIPDAILAGTLASVDQTAVTSLRNLTESDCLDVATSLLTQGESSGTSMTDDQAHAIITLLGMSNHMVLQGRRNLFGPAGDTGYTKTKWETGTRSKLQSWRPEDRHVLSHQFSNRLSDPLGTMLYNAPVRVMTDDGETTIFHQHAVREESIVFKSSDDQYIRMTGLSDSEAADADVTWVSTVPSTASSSDHTNWTDGDAVTVANPTRLSRIMRSRSSLQTVIGQLLTQAAQHQSTTAEAAYRQSQDLIAVIQSDTASPDEKSQAYSDWLSVSTLASVYRAHQLSVGETGAGEGYAFSDFQSLYTTSTAGWDDTDVAQTIAGHRIFSDTGYFEMPDDTLAAILQSDKQHFDQASISQTRVAALRNDRQRDRQALKAAGWVRDYKAWQDEKASLIV